MDSDAKLNILTEALAAAGASALAIDARGDVAISTMNDAALERDVAAFVAERLDRIGDGARLVMGRAGTRLSLTVRPTDKEGGDFGSSWSARCAVPRRMRASSGSTPTKLRARYESSAYGIVEGAAAVAAPVSESYARGVPLLLEGELARARSRSPSASIWTVLLPISPLFPSRSMNSPIAVGAMCSKAPNRRCSKRG